MKHPYPSNVRNLVTIPFLDSTTDYQELMKMPNDNGTTPKLLLDALNKVMYDDTVEGSDSSDSSLDNAQKVCKAWGSPTYTVSTNTVSTNTIFGLCTCKWGN